MTDLNARVLPGAPGAIVVAGDINSDGVITGRLQKPDGTTTAFLAWPR